MEIESVLNDVAELIPESLEGARRVQVIVQNLRDFTHPSVESRESADINRCLDATLAILAPQIPAGVAIAKAYQPLAQISCYLREINQVFYQILRNALQATGAQGRIAIATRADGQQVEIRIADSGPGIPPEHHGRIFDPFFTTREVGQGTGLGLHLAHRIVRKHGGDIAVASPPGQGATLIVRLPLNASNGMD
jgi:two-component system NtrC family sensor kinase